MSQITIPDLEEMISAGVHFGHATSRWHPKMKPFLFGKRGGIHIIDLVKTKEKLEEAARFAHGIAKDGKTILFVGVKPLGRQIVKEEAKRAKSPYVVNRWIGGTLTNWSAVLGMIKRMKQIEQDTESGKFGKYTKFEQQQFAEEYKKLDNDVGGLRNLSGKPDALFVVDAIYDKTAISEAKKLKIPVICISDSNINPDKFEYPIPGNNDALKSIELITRTVSDAVVAGRDSRAEN
jgi:small subunit ribosomal protein S2